jgi:glycosyltransferase involved in cell wall biosynthesis
MSSDLVATARGPCASIEGKVVIVVSNEPWGEVWYVKHHYAVELARHNRVYFVNPPRPWSLGHLAMTPPQVALARPNLWTVDYENLLPVRASGRMGNRFNDWLIGRRLAASLPCDGGRIVWQFDPFRFVTLHGLGAKRIYHVADDYARHPNNVPIARQADLVCCTSAPYVPVYGRLNSNVLHVPHGVSEDEFSIDAAEVDRITRRFGRFLFFAGGIERRTNLDLLTSVATRYPLAGLVIAGPNKLGASERAVQFERLIRLPNVSYLGPVPGNELKNYIRAATVCLVVYRFGEADGAGGTSSHKVLKYLAQKKPVISTLLPEPASLAGRALYFADREEGYLELVTRSLESGLAVDEGAVTSHLSGVRYSMLFRQIAERLA